MLAVKQGNAQQEDFSQKNTLRCLIAGKPERTKERGEFERGTLSNICKTYLADIEESKYIKKVV